MPEVEFPTPWHIVTFCPAYVLVITVTPTAAEDIPTIGQALSFTSMLIVEKWISSRKNNKTKCGSCRTKI